MNRTKAEIIARIEAMTGYIYSDGERANLMTLTKDALASKTMRLVRSLPPPPDPLDELVQVIQMECHRQFEDNEESDGTWILMNSRKLAQAILKSGVTRL